MTQEDFILQATKAISEELPGFWFTITRHVFLSHPYVVVRIAAKDYLINNVDGQRPQAVSLSYTDGKLGSHHRHVYREPDRNIPDEKFLAMKGERVPFRTNAPGKEINTLRTFCRNYKETLRKFKPVLCYRDIVNYDEIC